MNQTRGFSGAYDAQGHRADVRRLLNGNHSEDELREIGRMRWAIAQRSGSSDDAAVPDADR